MGWGRQPGVAARLMRFARRDFALFIALGYLGLMVGGTIAASLRLNGGVFVYGRDDAYIHMAMAKNLVLHHLWGVTPYAFASASSSPLWTSLLALSYRLFGIGNKAPLVLGLISAVGLLTLLSRLLRGQGIGDCATLVTLLLVVFAMPLPYLVLDGMEAPLQPCYPFGSSTLPASS